MLTVNHWTEYGVPNRGVRERTEGVEGGPMAPAPYVAEDGFIWQQ
ncbi:hypothetical protein T4D_4920 [Trichinella pseudospiralis]|uniref:Uncharacterized protein n=1 Tax=Trichinella pseudospiralis TaxID=6337 RepID=A0A0V1DMK8_TRIPS|nr:hypothetical protein T4D_4920 [Trichinella pseudospiralis]